MIAILFLIISSLFGWCILSRLLPDNLQRDTVKIPAAIILGIFISVWLTFLLNLFFSFSVSIAITLYVLFLSCFFLAPFKKGKKRLLFFHFSLFEYILLGGLIVITTLLIHQSLHFTADSFFQIGTNEWGDFDIHLPLIRSFAWGNNMPPSLPFFPNTNSAYHFMFDYWSALLEYGGLPLSYAFNISSIISFTCLLFLLYTFAKILFDEKKIIGILTVIFFFFNSSFEFVEAYQKLHIKNFFEFFPEIVKNNHYFSVGPYSSDIVSIIWNMNVYLNQRHLLFGFAIGLVLLIFLYQLLNKHLGENYFIAIGFLIGLTPFWSIHIFLCLLIVTSILVLFYFKKNKKLLFIFPIAIGIAIPQLVWLSHDVRNFTQLNPGFLARRPLTTGGFLFYWIYNLGLSFFTLLIGFYFSSREQKKWFVALFGIFLLANIFQFNSDMVNNHKLFNFWLILSNSFTAYVIYIFIKKKKLWKLTIAFGLIFILTFSGIIDMFVVKNETFYIVSDYTQNTTLQWFVGNTPQNSTILVPTYNMYDPIRMAGRKTFVASPRYADAYGYNVLERDQLIQKIYRGLDASTTTVLLEKNNISYVELPKNNTTNIVINSKFFEENFPLVFSTNDFEIVAVP